MIANALPNLMWEPGEMNVKHHECVQDDLQNNTIMLTSATFTKHVSTSMISQALRFSNV